MSTRLATRMSRLLNMVPYLLAHPGISKPEAAADLGVTVAQLEDDLNQLWMCGLPGYSPGDLIDLAFTGDTVSVTFSAGMDRPLRLTSTEATALLVALRSIVEMPGMVDPSAAQGAMAKIESAAGAAARSRTGAAGDSELAAPAESPVTATVRSALYRSHALRLVYYSASRDTVSERIVDPIRVMLVSNHSYLQAWCRNAEAVRLFRFDRIDDATELDEPSRPPAAALHEQNALELFSDDPALPLARLLIAPGSAWALDQYPMTNVVVRADATVEATMRFATVDWMARMVLGFGSGMTALEPPELVEAIRERSASALTAYRRLDSGSTVPQSGSIGDT
ncbi:YafY family transcriptional regulator [Aldersonia sp. NBC_00410]|uniref:helix-turn-helix transcriptional regulator n=1 Tax=Aldersonia sp. NBC_00410 TaxID=2975954 RepID=UPI00225B398B|nr:YafY family protein [Aldersonia sp. NBC_00410]MCX5045827.1 YafY family transcriptional regulator [Aldersonia sp. NBC_00410]